MKTLVITGGTDGMGKALARTYLDQGDRVVIVGRDTNKAASLPNAHFIPADLSLISENKRVIEEVNTAFPAVDALVLCARYFRSRRFQTVEGIEGTFALDYLSRFLLSHGITEPRLIVNVSGPGGPPGLIHWNDLMLEHDYDGVAAQMQAGRANDLLGLAFANLHAGRRTRYVLINPGAVSTSFAGEYDPATAAHVEALKKYGKPVEQGITPIITRIDQPPAEPLSAFAQHQPISLDHPCFDNDAAVRLHRLTLEILENPGGSIGGWPLALG